MSHICHLAKQKRLPIPLSVRKAIVPSEMVQMDILWPYLVPSVHKHKFFLTVLDYYSHFVWIILLKTKWVNIVTSSVKLVETQFQAVIKVI